MTTTSTLSLRASKPPITPLSFDSNQPPTLRLWPLSNYTFGTKEQQPEEDPSVQARLKRLEDHYEQYGMRRTCEGILICHEHNHPHVLMLQIANAFYKLYVPTNANVAAFWEFPIHDHLTFLECYFCTKVAKPKC